MLKKIFLVLAMTTLSHAVWAETCPSVDSIKKQPLVGWKVYDSEDGTPLPTNRAQSYKKEIVAFTMVEWAKTGKESGAIHCYYRDKNGSNLEAYLAKNNFIFSSNNKYWYSVSGHMQCAGNAKHCEFQAPLIQQALGATHDNSL